MEKRFFDEEGDVITVSDGLYAHGVYIEFERGENSEAKDQPCTNMSLEGDTAVALAEYILRVSRKNV